MTGDEQALARRARAGDARAFGALVSRHSNAVYRLCWRHVGPADADDMTQETFLRAFVHRERFDPTRPLLPWLLTIARRLCLDHLRKRTPQPDAESAARLRDGAPSVEQTAAAREQITQMAAALRDLPDGPREAVALFHLESLSYDAIAHTLDVPKGTVMTWLHRGRARLRALLNNPQADRRDVLASRGVRRGGGT